MPDIHGHFHTGKNVSLDEIALKYNINRFPDYYNAPQASNGHLFMTVPDLNLIETNYMRDDMLMGLMMSEGADVYKKLLTGGRGMMPLIHNRCRSYGVKPFNLNVTEKGLTYFGSSIHYAKHSSDRLKAYSFSLEFDNDEFASIVHLMAIWSRYCWLVSRGRIEPQAKYEVSGQLDYAASIYYFNTDLTNTRINYWEKLVGVFPTSVPLDIFSKEDGPKLVDKVSIDFECCIPDDPFSISMLDEFATLNGHSSHLIHRPVSRIGLTFSDSPILHFKDSVSRAKSNSKLDCYLCWL